MFKKIKNLFTKKEQNITSDQKIDRDLFEELFPLSIEHQHIIEEHLKKIFSGMFGEEGYAELMSHRRSFPQVPTVFQGLRFDSLGWELEEEDPTHQIYRNDTGDFIDITIVSPSGKIDEQTADELPVFRKWFRDLFIHQGGGLIYCENLNHHEIDAFESIGKVPRQQGAGIDYIYHLNIRNYEKQKLYQLMVKLHEGAPTGLRDNILMHPLCDITALDMLQMMEYYRKDPYYPTLQEGNVMNLSEREEFDHYFPFHPLSIIRKEVKAQILESIRFE